MSKKTNGTGKQLTVRKNNTEPSVALMLQGVLQTGITTENVAAVEKLIGLYERMQDREAERQFNHDFNQLQSQLKEIRPTKVVPNKAGMVMYKYAPFDEIMAAVQSHLTKHGFSVSFNSRVEGDRIVSICTLSHTGGHSRSNEFAVRIGSGPPNASQTQADGAAKTYAKRGALSDALNIVIDSDDDARLLGEPIGRAIAEEFMKRVRDLGANEQAFLKFAGVQDAADPATIEDYMKIRDTNDDANFTRLDKALRDKEQTKPKPSGRKEERDPVTSEFIF